MVFPGEPSIMAVEEIMSQSDKLLRGYDQKLAFVLPFTARGHMMIRATKKYGNKVARGVFRGGGPFMLKDSPDMLPLAFKRLGYLDDGLNADVSEAMFCFINAFENKLTLRKMGMLPSPSSSSLDLQEKLHAAFPCHAQSGHCRIPRPREDDVTKIFYGVFQNPILSIHNRICLTRWGSLLAPWFPSMALRWVNKEARIGWLWQIKTAYNWRRSGIHDLQDQDSCLEKKRVIDCEDLDSKRPKQSKRPSNP